MNHARAAGIEGDDMAAVPALRALPAETLVKGTEGYALAIVGGPEIPGLSHSIIDGSLSKLSFVPMRMRLLTI